MHTNDCECTSVMASHLYTKVAARTVHLGYVRPAVGVGVVPLAIVHPGDSVEAPHGVHVTVVRNHADATASVAHGRDHRPLVGGWVVVLGRVEALLAVEAPGDVHAT